MVKMKRSVLSPKIVCRALVNGILLILAMGLATCQSAAITKFPIALSTVEKTDTQLPIDTPGSSALSRILITATPIKSTAWMPTLSLTQQPIITREHTESLNWQGILAVLAYPDLLDPILVEEPQVYLIYAGDSEPHSVFSGEYSYPPISWAPDGSALVFSGLGKRSTGSFDLFVLFLNTMELIPLEFDLVGGANHNTPSWSPDGQYIVFSQSGGFDQLIHIYSLVENKTHYITNGIKPAWSTSESIVFFRPYYDENYKFYGRGDLFHIGINGQGEKQLTTGMQIHDFAVSPDGKTIAVVGENITNDTSGIFLVSSESAGMILLYPEFMVDSLSWHPDGQQLLAAKNCRIFLLRTDQVSRISLKGLSFDYCYTFAALQP
jgi:WD40 repeat protein